VKQQTIVCRCEDLTVEDVEQAIDEGFTDLEELRRKLRIGMGPCQGRICVQLVIKILAKKTGKKVSEIAPPTSRPPLIPVSLGTLSSEEL
jgi:NAD(P)H-nitrite reductase large subunit